MATHNGAQPPSCCCSSPVDHWCAGMVAAAAAQVWSHAAALAVAGHWDLLLAAVLCDPGVAVSWAA
jgi:hypothetical protein